jgi:hypothetical protein
MSGRARSELPARVRRKNATDRSITGRPAESHTPSPLVGSANREALRFFRLFDRTNRRSVRLIEVFLPPIIIHSPTISPGTIPPIVHESNRQKDARSQRQILQARRHPCGFYCMHVVAHAPFYAAMRVRRVTGEQAASQCDKRTHSCHNGSQAGPAERSGADERTQIPRRGAQSAPNEPISSPNLHKLQIWMLATAGRSEDGGIDPRAVAERVEIQSAGVPVALGARPGALVRLRGQRYDVR